MASSSASSSSEPAPTVEVMGLSYKFPDETIGLHDITLSLPAGSRTLLIGANGAGKTTLLRLLSGKRLSPPATILIGGADPFSTPLSGITYLGLEWVLNPIVRTDISVVELMASVGGDAYPARRDELIHILDIDTRWRMHAVSDGERRRVQLAMGLVKPWSTLLLDEVTVDLDVLARGRFLGWLKMESERRNATVVYATHIMDGLAEWPTYLVRMSLGRVKYFGRADEILKEMGERLDREKGVLGLGRNSTLLELALRWLEEDLKERGPRGGGDRPQVQGIQVEESAQSKSYGYMDKIE